MMLHATGLQRIAKPPGATVFNHTAIGKAVQRAARKCMPHMVGKHDCGFQDGGCRMFATALQRWSDEVLKLSGIHAFECPRYVQHVIASYNDRLFLDSDGLCTEPEMIAKLDRFESGRTYFLEPRLYLSKHDSIPYDNVTVQTLTMMLRKHLGPFDPSSFDEAIAASATPTSTP